MAVIQERVPGQDVEPTPPKAVDPGWWAGRRAVRGDTRVEVAKSIAGLREDLSAQELQVFNAGVLALRNDASAAAARAMAEMALQRDEALDFGFAETYDGLRVREILERGKGAILANARRRLERPRVRRTAGSSAATHGRDSALSRA
jgi:hypothetical protein